MLKIQKNHQNIVNGFSSLLVGIIASICLTSLPTFAQDIRCSDLPQFFQSYLNQHVMISKVDQPLKDRAANQYLEYLDGTKTILLEADVNNIKSQIMTLFGNFEAGKVPNCAPLEKIQSMIVEKTTENEKFVTSFLNEKYQLDENVEFVFDSKKRSYPKTVEERNDFQKKLIHFQISNYLLGGDIKLPEAKTKLVHRYELITKRVREKTYIDQMNAFLDAFASGLDPHSSFMSRDKLEDFRIDFSLALEGIGASLSSQDGYTVVEEIIPGGAADRAKVLRPKDKIISVAQDGGPYENVIDVDLRDVVKKIRGKKGTKVRLTVLRQSDKAERLEIEIVRDKVNLAEQAAKISYKTKKVGNKTLTFGILELPSFYGGESDDGKVKTSSYEDVRNLLLEAKKKKVSGIVLNLSRNGGGLLDEGVKISGLFIQEGPIVATQNKVLNKEENSDTNSETAYSGPLIVLTSRVSASASEILAGAMKDYKRALIVGGDRTFGKGTVQAVYPIAKGIGAMKVTTGMFFVPGGKSTQREGVKGDISLPSLFNSSDELGEASLDNALPAITISPFLGSKANSEVAADKWTPVTDDLIAKLRDRSAERISKDPKFAEIRKEIEESKKSDGVIKLAEIRKKSTADKKKQKDEEKKTFAQRTSEADAPFINESLNIFADWIGGVKELPPTAKTASKDEAKN